MKNLEYPHLILGRTILLKFILELNGTQQHSITGDKHKQIFVQHHLFDLDVNALTC